MDENVSPELYLAPEPEQSHEPMDSSSQAVTEAGKGHPEQVDDASDERLEYSETSAKATSEVRKTWGFRRTTIAKREMPGEVAPESHEGPGGVRRSGRQAKRTDKLEEFLSTKRGGRRSAPASLEGGDPPSQTPTDAETASEASFDGNADTKSVDDKSESPERRTRSGSRKKLPATAKGGGRRSRGRKSVKDEGSSENEHEEDGGDGGGDERMKSQSKDEDDPEKERKEAKPSPAEVAVNDAETTKSEHEAVNDVAATTAKEEDKREEVEDTQGKKTDKEEQEGEDSEDDKEKPTDHLAKRTPLRTYTNKRKAANKNSIPTKNPAPIKKDAKAKVGQAVAKSGNVLEDEESSTSSSSSSSSSSDSEGAGYDPNALYCICRQKHNKRFMICCDRCEEWFHGDCVGITEARGRLMERNGEDYICPNCTAKKSQVVKPATSVLPGTSENGKSKGLAAALNSVAGVALKVETTASVATSSSTGTGGPEERTEGDHGIKGRIEKATNPSGKKKIKIFQPALVKTAEQKGAEKVEPIADKSSLPKCIGPGCERNAQPDSVYCGNDCILRHAAAAMKSITDVKEPKQKDKPKAQKTPGPRSAPKRSSTGRRKTFKKTVEMDESYSEEEEDDDDDEYHDDDDEDEHAQEHPPPPAAASWSSDHNYNAVTPEKTTPISPTVLNKTCMYLLKVLKIYF